MIAKVPAFQRQPNQPPETQHFKLKNTLFAVISKSKRKSEAFSFKDLKDSFKVLRRSEILPAKKLINGWSMQVTLNSRHIVTNYHR